MITIEIRNAGMQERKRQFRDTLTKAVVRVAELNTNADVTVDFCCDMSPKRGPLEIEILGAVLSRVRDAVSDIGNAARRYYEEQGYRIRPVSVKVGEDTCLIGAE